MIKPVDRLPGMVITKTWYTPKLKSLKLKSWQCCSTHIRMDVRGKMELLAWHKEKVTKTWWSMLVKVDWASWSYNSSLDEGFQVPQSKIGKHGHYLLLIQTVHVCLTGRNLQGSWWFWQERTEVGGKMDIQRFSLSAQCHEYTLAGNFICYQLLLGSHFVSFTRTRYGTTRGWLTG